MNRSRQRAERIKQRLDIRELLSEYGYDVSLRGDEQQFRCDMHGSYDARPSARVYPDTESFYCYGCQKNRDVIQLVMDKESVDFAKACWMLEKKLGLKPLDPETIENEIKEETVGPTMFEQGLGEIIRFLEIQTSEKSITLEDACSFWEAFDAIRWQVFNGHWTEERGFDALAQLSTKIMEAVE